MAIRAGSLESLEISALHKAYRGRRVLVTGHSGFKGSWLALWLTELGAQVTGFSAERPVSEPDHWALLDLPVVDVRGDVRNGDTLASLLKKTQPQIVFHLAAQSLVRRSYADPPLTWSTNVGGTVNLLEACCNTRSVRAVVTVTSDKCYEHRSVRRPFREDDRLGGRDPYSASKAATEWVVESYRNARCSSHESALLATARAGNVIGGGDWAEDRLIPDVYRSVVAGIPMRVRCPTATRPWQHALESLSGYLLLGKRLLDGDRSAATAWNFGPRKIDTCTVADLLTKLQTYWPSVEWHDDPSPQPKEAELLSISSRKARDQLEWRPVWTLDAALRATTRWYRSYMEEQQVVTRDQLRAYCSDARKLGLSWALA